MTSKHTPGPWTVYPRDGSYQPAVQRGKEGGFVVNGTSPEQEDADARVIAAAPTMYDFVQNAANRGDADAKAILEAIHGRS